MQPVQDGTQATRRGRRKLLGAAALLGVIVAVSATLWLRLRPLQGNVPIFYADWNGLACDSVEIRLESPGSDVLLFKPTGLFEVSQPTAKYDIVRFDSKTKAISRVDVDAWERATGSIRNKENSPKVPIATPSEVEKAEVQRHVAEPIAAKHGVDFAICPECPEIAAYLSAEGPFVNGGFLGPYTIGGQHYVELRYWRQERRIGQPIPVQFDKCMWNTHWSGDCRFVVYTTGIGASLRIAVIPVSELAAEMPCSNSKD